MGYYITIKNELLEPKHVEAMGAAVWLFMFFLDKVMAINENGIGKVLNGRPIIFCEHVEPMLGISRRTYARWLADLQNAGYIKTLRTPMGLVIYVQKAEKMWGQKGKSKNQQLFTDEGSANNGTSKKLKKQTRLTKNGTSDVPHVAHRGTKNGTSNKDSYIDNSNNNRPMAKAVIVSNSEISKLYFQVIKAYALPILNHNIVHSKIRQWEKEDEPQKTINYLKFLLNQYPGIVLKFKPEINNALDIYSKRTQIKNALKREIGKQQQRKIKEV